jgi:hypothetical protein
LIIFVINIDLTAPLLPDCLNAIAVRYNVPAFNTCDIASLLYHTVKGSCAVSNNLLLGKSFRLSYIPIIIYHHPAVVTAKCDLNFSNFTRKLVVSLNLEILNNDNLNLQFDVVL